MKRYGYAASEDDIHACCNYLAGKGLITMQKIENKVLGISRDIAHITPEGTDVLEGTVTIDGITLR
jgi:hypothetical protein